MLRLLAGKVVDAQTLPAKKVARHSRFKAAALLPSRLNDWRWCGDVFRCMQKIRERFCSRADNRTEVIGEKRREDDTLVREGGARSRPTTRKNRRQREGGCCCCCHGVTGWRERPSRWNGHGRERRGGNLGFKYFALWCATCPKLGSPCHPFQVAQPASKKVPWDHPPPPRSPAPSYKTLPVFRIIPPQPANFLSRETLLSAFRRLLGKKERAKGEKPEVNFSRPGESKNFRELLFDRPLIRRTNIFLAIGVSSRYRYAERNARPKRNDKRKSSRNSSSRLNAVSLCDLPFSPWGTRRFTRKVAGPRRSPSSKVFEGKRISARNEPVTSFIRRFFRKNSAGSSRIRFTN